MKNYFYIQVKFKMSKAGKKFTFTLFNVNPIQILYPDPETKPDPTSQ